MTTNRNFVSRNGYWFGPVLAFILVVVPFGALLTWLEVLRVGEVTPKKGDGVHDDEI